MAGTIMCQTSLGTQWTTLSIISLHTPVNYHLVCLAHPIVFEWGFSAQSEWCVSDLKGSLQQLLHPEPPITCSPPLQTGVRASPKAAEWSKRRKRGPTAGGGRPGFCLQLTVWLDTIPAPLQVSASSAATVGFILGNLQEFLPALTY